MAKFQLILEETIVRIWAKQRMNWSIPTLASNSKLLKNSKLQNPEEAVPVKVAIIETKNDSTKDARAQRHQS
jgi:hypothetical protein